jgi:hypothetical protein
VIEIRKHLSIAGTVLMLMFLLAGCNASETPILTVTAANLSLNLTPNYNMSSVPITTSGEGYIGQLILINNTENMNDSSMLSLISFSDISVLELEADDILIFMDNMLSGIFRLGGADEKESYNLKDHSNQNVTVRVFEIPDAENPLSSNLTYMTSLRLDQLNYLYIFSMDKNLTNNIVENLELVD